ncbi:F-box protein At5g07610-like [Argentina anserina]|uniref:F-box protein At5g07610-like n=1 Tax=Argentina anserina TaxID=57926 RepID=UPI0021768401|nr:F-box protein At5g07610-like [Potentilla anserina]
MMQTLKRCSTTGSLGESILDYEDILTEILVRVPALALVRCKCVSKRWLSFLSNPKFCHLHTLRNPRPPISGFFSELSKRFYFVPLDIDHDRPTSPTNCRNQTLTGSARSHLPTCNPLNFVLHPCGIQIMQSCNGLFLCRIQPLDDTANRLVYYVLNPTTNKFSPLTPPAAAAAASTGDPRVFGYALAFDPSKSPHYKVVFLWFVEEPVAEGIWWPYYHIEVYSSETRSWRLLDSSFETQSQVDYRLGVYCNGAVHWLGMDCEMSYYHIDEERVGFVDGFPSYGANFHSTMCTYVRESHAGGRLHLIDIKLQSPTQFTVFEMGKDYSGWFSKYNVDLDPLCTAYPHILQYRCAILSLAPDENDEDEESSYLLMLHTPGTVISYNLKNNTFKSTDLIPKVPVDDSYCRVGYENYRYVESLAVV